MRKTLSGINIAEQQELLNEIGHERIDVSSVKAIPGIVRARARQRKRYPPHLRMIAVVTLHSLPLAIVELLGRAAASVHGDE